MTSWKASFLGTFAESVARLSVVRIVESFISVESPYVMEESVGRMKFPAAESGEDSLSGNNCPGITESCTFREESVVYVGSERKSFLSRRRLFFLLSMLSPVSSEWLPYTALR